MPLVVVDSCLRTWVLLLLRAVEEEASHKPGDGLAADELVVVSEQTEEDHVHHTFDEAEGSFASSC